MCQNILLYWGISVQSTGNKKDEKGTITGKAMRIYKLINRCAMAFIKKKYITHTVQAVDWNHPQYPLNRKHKSVKHLFWAPICG